MCVTCYEEIHLYIDVIDSTYEKIIATIYKNKMTEISVKFTHNPNPETSTDTWEKQRSVLKDKISILISGIIEALTTENSAIRKIVFK